MHVHPAGYSVFYVFILFSGFRHDPAIPALGARDNQGSRDPPERGESRLVDEWRDEKK
jgi:hypothetical protein